MDVHGHPCFPWASMDIHGHPWFSMGIHGYSCASMVLHGCTWISMFVFDFFENAENKK